MLIKVSSPKQVSEITPGLAVSSLLCLVLLTSSCSLIKTADYYVASGNRYVKKAQYREAAIQYMNAIKLNPQHPRAHHELGRIAVRMGDIRSADLELAQAVDLDPNNLEARTDYGMVLIQTGRIDDAERQGRAVLARAPDNADAHIIMALVNGAHDDSHAALTEAQAAIKAKPSEAKPYITLAGAHAQLREFAEAERVLIDFQKSNPKIVETYIALGELYEIEKKFDLAEATFIQGINADKTNSQPRVRLLNQYVVLHQWDKAKQVATQAKADNPNDPLSYRMMGDFLLWTGDMQGCLDEYAKAVKEHPYDYRMGRAYVQLLLFGDRVDEADKLNQRLMKQFGADPMSLIARGQILVRQGKPGDAVPVLKSALRAASNNYLAHLYLGIALQQTNDPVGSEREIREAQRVRPTNPGTQFMLAELGRTTRNVDLMFNSAENLLAAFPRSASAYVLRGTAALAWKQNAGGEADFKKAIEMDPKSPVGYAALGQLRIEQGKYPDAEKLLRQALQADPNYSYALRQLSLLLAKTGRSGEAIKRLSERLATAPNNANSQAILGEIQFIDKQFSAAEASLLQAVKLSPELDSAWQVLGQAQAAQGNLEGTIATYDRWGIVSPINALPYILLGEVHEMRHDWSLAEKAYRKALDRDPENPIAANNLANGMLERNGDPQAALSLALLATKANPNSTVIADTVGLAYIRQAKYQQASEVLSNALRSDERNASLHFHLSQALREVGQLKEAAAHLEIARKLDPELVASNEERDKVHEYFVNQNKRQ
jgi:tetratricopeptide (TPR) repeat protein